MPNRWIRDANNVLVPKIPVGGLPDGSVVSADIAENTIVDADIASGAFPSITGIGVLATDLVFADAVDITLNSTTGTKIGTATTEKIGFWNTTPVVQPTALTTAETTLTFVDENTPDFLLSSLTIENATAGFATLDEAQGFVEACIRTQTRVGELETKLRAIGLLA